jgi:hypothetical protein
MIVENKGFLAAPEKRFGENPRTSLAARRGSRAFTAVAHGRPSGMTGTAAKTAKTAQRQPFVKPGFPRNIQLLRRTIAFYVVFNYGAK